MRCLHIHNDYLEKGGETNSAKLIAELLELKGVEVCQFHKSNAQLLSMGKVQKIKAAFMSVYNYKVINEINELCSKMKFDFALVHNISPMISNSIYGVLKKKRIPIYKYLQNYNAICLNGSCNKGSICDKCIKYPMIGVINKCYKQNIAYSFVKMINRIVFDKFYKSNINKYICISEFVKNKHLEWYKNKEKFCVLYHFDTAGLNIELKNQEYFLYIGRLTQNKGILNLLEYFEENKKVLLKIIGTGSLSEYVRKIANANENITYLGYKDGQEKNKLINNASFTIVPSIWDEPFGRIVIESYKNGTPVIVNCQGGLPELITSDTGYIVNIKKRGSLDEVIKTAMELSNIQYMHMAQKALEFYKSEFNQEDYFEKLIDIIGVKN